MSSRPHGRHEIDLAGLQQAMARYSERSVYAIQKLLAGQEHPKQKSGAFKRKAAQVLGPFRSCYREVSMPNAVEGRKDIVFYMANVKQMLTLLVDRCASFAALLVRTPEACALTAILAHDECTAGNVLNPLQRQKTCLYSTSHFRCCVTRLQVADRGYQLLPSRMHSCLPAKVAWGAPRRPSSANGWRKD